MVNENLRLALDLVIRESEIEAQNFATMRSNVSLLVSLGLTIDTLIASSALDRRSDTAQLWPFVTSMGVSVMFLLFGVHLLRLRPDVRPWPDQTKLGQLAVLGPSDAVRQLLQDFESALIKARQATGRFQREVIALIILLVISIGAWSWTLTTTNQVAPKNQAPIVALANPTSSR